MSTTDPTIAELGEHETLRRLQSFCTAVVGDDGAVQSLPAGEQLVVTTDVLVDGVHFSDRTLSPIDLGWRAAAVNLSDLAAMGAHPLGLTVGVTLPPETSWHWLEQVYQGLDMCLERYGGTILGGDLCRGVHRHLAITALGTVPQHRAFYRHRAQVGQVLVATGTHGASRAGLAILLGELSLEKSGLEKTGLTQAMAQSWISAHRRPKPRFDAIATLQALGLQTTSTAMMDSSDGLADAVIQIAAQSQVGARLLCSQLPMPDGLVDTVGRATAEHWTLYGGEDFELVLSLPPTMAAVLVKQLPGSQVVGEITSVPTVQLIDDLGQRSDIYLDQSQGYQHFQAQ